MRVSKPWPHLLIEAGGAALILFVACVVATLLHHPSSPIPHLAPAPAAQRALMGLAMGSMVAAIAYSRLGRRSGAHLNPAVTLAFLRLRRVPPADAGAYIAAQLVGVTIGIAIATLLLGRFLAHPTVHYVTTRPGPRGALIAVVAEIAISTILMTVVLIALGTRNLMRYAGLFSAMLVALFIAFESPLSGASMNPARSFGSALGASEWATLWIYLVGPPIGMVLAAEIHRRRSPAPGEGEIGSIVGCAKLVHDDQQCQFCDYRWARAEGGGRSAGTNPGKSSHAEAVPENARAALRPPPPALVDPGTIRNGASL